MNIELTCPGCQKLLRVPGANAGKRVRIPLASMLWAVGYLMMAGQLRSS